MGMAEVRLLLEGVFDEGEQEIMRRFARDGLGVQDQRQGVPLEGHI